MARMIPEPDSARRRRQAFIATCSPDELLGQVVQTLCPQYDIDAPHLLALRQLLSSAIVAPKTPPTLKRTRPDKRIGELGSISDASRRFPYGSNGPPVSADQSFYFHHQDVDFETLLPQVDRSRYVWIDEPASQPDSDEEKIPDGEESLQPLASIIKTPAIKHNISTTSTSSVRPAPTSCTERAAARACSLPREPRPTVRLRLASSDEHLFSPGSSHEKPLDDTVTDSQRRSLPTVIVTTPRSIDRIVTSEHEDTMLSSPIVSAANSDIELPHWQDSHSGPPPPSSALPTRRAQCSETQDTLNSTQPSEVSSWSEDLVHYTPPTQEETQQEAWSQAETPSLYARMLAIETAENAPTPLTQCSPRVLRAGPLVPALSLGKRSREKSEAVDDGPSLKRSKQNEAF